MYGAFEIFNVIGIATLIGGLIYIGRKLQVLDDLKKTLGEIDSDLCSVSKYLDTHSETKK